MAWRLYYAVTGIWQFDTCGEDLETWKLCHFNLTSHTATAESTSGVPASAIRLRSASVNASGSNAAQIAMCVSSNSLNVRGRGPAD